MGIYCLIADNSCPFGSIVREALLLFVRICIDIMVIDSYYLSSSLVIDYFPVFLDYVNIVCCPLFGWSICIVSSL